MDFKLKKKKGVNEGKNNKWVYKKKNFGNTKNQLLNIKIKLEQV